MNATAQQPGKYSPRLAWLSASAYFAACLALSVYTGVWQRLDVEPWAWPGQVFTVSWHLATYAVTAYAVFAYVYYWPRGTVTCGRPRRRIAGWVFGALWGFCQGQLMLVVYVLIAKFGLHAIFTVMLTFLVWSVFAALWQSRFWDVYVSPEHNLEEWNTRKILVAHMPFLLLCLAHYAAFNNARVFVCWQIMALTASTLAMRFPSPLDD